ncbi:unnamed protein product [Schistocephalus solidus]|uniref:Secreted protein n=1 Tax=Schistocephalus solidus TaxID=70667 RepID=A0A183TBL1_SCHSO|nr:unnamed protein product [Schistocephalus solidus]
MLAWAWRKWVGVDNVDVRACAPFSSALPPHAPRPGLYVNDTFSDSNEAGQLSLSYRCAYVCKASVQRGASSRPLLDVKPFWVVPLRYRNRSRHDNDENDATAAAAAAAGLSTRPKSTWGEALRKRVRSVSLNKQ